MFRRICLTYTLNKEICRAYCRDASGYDAVLKMFARLGVNSHLERIVIIRKPIAAVMAEYAVTPGLSVDLAQVYRIAAINVGVPPLKAQQIGFAGARSSYTDDFIMNQLTRMKNIGRDRYLKMRDQMVANQGA